MNPWKIRLSAVLLCTLSIVSTIGTVFLFNIVRSLEDARPRSRELWEQQVAKDNSWKGDDHPSWLPMRDPPRPIQMVAEESTHYSMERRDEYEWMYNSPYGTGAVRLGPDNRAFFVSMFHQLHCIRYFQSEVHSKREPAWGHLTHCLNYIRQMVLCSGDLTLEPGDFTRRNFTEDRTGETYLCRDWDAIYDELANNWIQWYKYKKTHNLTDLPTGTDSE